MKFSLREQMRRIDIIRLEMQQIERNLAQRNQKVTSLK